MTPKRRLSVILPTGLPSRLSGMRLGLSALASAITAHLPSAHVRVLHIHEEAAPLPAEVDVVVFSLANPLEFQLVFDFCRAASVPRRAQHRNGMPLFVGGGIGFANPEPLANFFDVIIRGLDPKPLLSILDILTSEPTAPRTSLLEEMARVPNVYVPEMVVLKYSAGGEVASIHCDHAPAVQDAGETARPLSGWIDESEAVLMPDIGCKSRCSFCALTFFYDYRAAGIQELIREVDQLAARGVKRIKINSATVFQYAHVDELLNHVRRKGMEVAIGSVRVDQVHPRHLEALQGIHAISATQFLYRDGIANHAPSLTFGVESASVRLLRLINKGLDPEQVNARLSSLAKHGLKNVGLHFLCGIPTETRADRVAVAAMIDHAAGLVGDVGGQVFANVNPLIATPQTPMQRAPICSTAQAEEWFEDVGAELLDRLGSHRYANLVRLTRMPKGDHLIQTLTIRSDRRIGAVLEEVYDSGTGHTAFDDDDAERLLERAGLPQVDFYRRRIADDEILPWELVESPRLKLAEAAYLRRERDAMEAASTTL